MLTAYLINGEPIGAIIQMWENSQLNGNPPFKIEDTISEGYVDISSITYWDAFGILAGKDFLFIKKQIKLLRISIGYNNLPLNEQIIANKYFSSGVEYNNAQVSNTEQAIFFYNFSKPLSYDSRFTRDTHVVSIIIKYLYTGIITSSTYNDLVEDTAMYRAKYIRDAVYGLNYGDSIVGITDYINNTNGFSPFAVIGIDIISKTFLVLGDKIDKLIVGKSIKIRDSSGNNGRYTITNSVFDSTNTIITVSEAIPSSVVDGNIYHSGFLFYEGTTSAIADNLIDIYINGNY